MKILSSFTHPHVIPNLYEFLYFGNQTALSIIVRTNKQINSFINLHLLKYILYVSENKVCRTGL